MSFDRKPLNQHCAAPPTASVMVDPCAALPMLRAQLYALMSGQVTQQIRDGDRWQSFHPGNVTLLRREITRLEIICLNCQPRTVRAGPPRPSYLGGYNRGGYR